MKPGKEDFGLGKSHVSVLSQPPPLPPMPRVHSGVWRTLRQGRPRACHHGAHEGARAAARSVTCCRRPPGRTGVRARRSAVLQERGPGGAVHACPLRPPLLPLQQDTLEGGRPGTVSRPGGGARRKGWRGRGSQSRRGLGGALTVRKAELGPHTPRSWGWKGTTETWRGHQARTPGVERGGGKRGGGGGGRVERQRDKRGNGISRRDGDEGGDRGGGDEGGGRGRRMRIGKEERICGLAKKG